MESGSYSLKRVLRNVLFGDDTTCTFNFYPRTITLDLAKPAKMKTFSTDGSLEHIEITLAKSFNIGNSDKHSSFNIGAFKNKFHKPRIIVIHAFPNIGFEEETFPPVPRYSEHKNQEAIKKKYGN